MQKIDGLGVYDFTASVVQPFHLDKRPCTPVWSWTLTFSRERSSCGSYLLKTHLFFYSPLFNAHKLRNIPLTRGRGECDASVFAKTINRQGARGSLPVKMYLRGAF